MSAVVFETDGEIDLRAFTTMGLTAKPNTASPIGYFGTGLKYAMAVLCRIGAEPEVFIGRDKYTFQRKSTTFRGTSFELLRMKSEKWHWTKPRWQELPYTTQYGRNWKAWQALRELESNTRDENGASRILLGELEPSPGRTIIRVDHPEFFEAYKKLDEIFLPSALREEPSAGGTTQVLGGGGKTLYWRGMKVKELEKPTLFTYNFLGRLELTEDRTLASEFSAKWMLGEHLARYTTDEGVIEKVLQAKEGSWEYEMDVPSWVEPSETFKRVIARVRPGRTWESYYDRYASPPSNTVFRPPLEEHPLPWDHGREYITDVNGREVMARPGYFQGNWEGLAELVCAKMNEGWGEPKELEDDEPSALPEEAVIEEAIQDEIP